LFAVAKEGREKRSELESASQNHSKLCNENRRKKKLRGWKWGRGFAPDPTISR